MIIHTGVLKILLWYTDEFNMIYAIPKLAVARNEHEVGNLSVSENPPCGAITVMAKTLDSWPSWVKTLYFPPRLTVMLSENFIRWQPGA